MGRVRELLFCHGTASAVGSAHSRGCKESYATEEAGMDRHDERKNWSRAGDEKRGRLRMKKKKKKKEKMSDLREKVKPLITVQEDAGEQLYAIVDFSLPDDPEIRRIISKRHSTGNISAVTYIGKVGADRTCSSKRAVMNMDNVPPARFWQSVQIMELLYRARGATMTVSRYDGKTMREAAELMKSLDAGRVWIGSECDQINL